MGQYTLPPGHIGICPSDMLHNRQAPTHCSSYSTNFYVDWTKPDWPQMKRPGRMKRPGQYIWLLENLGTNLTFSANTYPMKSSASQASGVEFRHGGKVNALLMDGHCESMELRRLYGTSAACVYSEKP